MAEPRPVSPSQEVEETTPLLVTDGGEQSEAPAPLPSSSNAENLNGPLPGSASRLFKHIRRTTYVSIVSSFVTLILLLATFVTITVSPYNWYYYWVDILVDLGITILLSLILTVLNLSAIRHPFPPQNSAATTASSSHLTPRSSFLYLPLTLCIDLVFAIFIFGLSGRLSSETPFDYYCREQRGPGPGNRVADCHGWDLALRILCYLGVAMAVVVGFCHLILFILRSMTVLRYGLWSQPTAWIIPTTGISINFTVKILGSESGRVNAVEA